MGVKNLRQLLPPHLGWRLSFGNGLYWLLVASGRGFVGLLSLVMMSGTSSQLGR